jgi:2-deoxy-D-gluconate 3-dehydrogenase
VVIAGRNETKAQAALSELHSLGAQAEFVALDVLTEASCYRSIERAVERFGRLDVLVNNAGTSIRKAPEDLTVQDWNLVMNTNLTSAFLCSQAAYPHMLRAGGGKIINIGSMMSIFGMPFATAYAASKGGIVQMTRAMATAWAKDNIQVNTILPGWIDTDLTRSARQQIPDLHEKVLARTPAHRWGTPDDFTGIAVFLGSPASNFITGVAIPVDGGYSIQG